jgi:hypothetical protein
MFSDLDSIIFPDSCEVIQVASQQYVYPIFKNGKSSLTTSAITNGWTVITNDDISSITDPITVFLRDPRERFISGVNTYIQHLKQNNPELDIKTILFFINKYLFLNRHYCPQFFWLINLAKYLDPATKLYFCDYLKIATLTTQHSKAGVTPPSQEIIDGINNFNWHTLELYFFLDQQLIELIGKSLTFQELITNIRITQPELYDLVFDKTIKLTNVLS